MTILQGDALERLRELPSDHFHCVVTSPPYWGLRDYGVDGQIGLEETPEQWLARLVEVFREVRRVLRPDGVCFVNIGDSYAQHGQRRDDVEAAYGAEYRARTAAVRDDKAGSYVAPTGWGARGDRCARSAVSGLKPKDLVGQPWMLAFALRADGWWLRGDYIWAKPNPMPESVRDRCTKAHEMVFHLTKSGESTFWVHRDKPGTRTRPAPDYRWRHKETGEEVAVEPPDLENWRRFNLWAGWDYFWDAEAVREPNTEGSIARYRNGAPRSHVKEQPGADGRNFPDWSEGGRNLRSVWTIATEPLPSITVDGEKLDHFASYPIGLARRCILAGTSAKGCCPECGAPWARVVEPGKPLVSGERNRGGRTDGFTTPAGGAAEWAQHVPPKTTGWRPTCSCDRAFDLDAEQYITAPCRVLDPFGGSGRTALAAEELGRDCTLIELNPASVRMAHAQIERARARRHIGDDVSREPPDPRQGQLTLVA